MLRPRTSSVGKHADECSCEAPRLELGHDRRVRCGACHRVARTDLGVERGDRARIEYRARYNKLRKTAIERHALIPNQSGEHLDFKELMG